MSKQKKNSRKNDTTEKLVLTTAILGLIKMSLEIIKLILEYLN